MLCTFFCSRDWNDNSAFKTSIAWAKRGRRRDKPGLRHRWKHLQGPEMAGHRCAPCDVNRARENLHGGRETLSTSRCARLLGAGRQKKLQLIQIILEIIRKGCERSCAETYLNTAWTHYAMRPLLRFKRETWGHKPEYIGTVCHAFLPL